MPGFNRVGVLCADEFDAESGKEIASDGGRRSSGAVEVFGAVLTLLSAAFILLTFPLTAWMCAKVVQEYESAVIFRLGRVVKGRAKGPGLLWFIPWLDVIRKVDRRTVSFNIRPQEVLTADGVPLMVDAVVFYRVVDPLLWVMQVQNGYQATVKLAQTTLRATLGANTLMDVLTHRPGIAAVDVLRSQWNLRRGLLPPHRAPRCLHFPAGLTQHKLLSWKSPPVAPPSS